jgi:hypothetical protein
MDGDEDGYLQLLKVRYAEREMNRREDDEIRRELGRRIADTQERDWDAYTLVNRKERARPSSSIGGDGNSEISGRLQG